MSFHFNQSFTSNQTLINEAIHNNMSHFNHYSPPSSGTNSFQNKIQFNGLYVSSNKFRPSTLERRLPSTTAKNKLFCGFCKRNGETMVVYTSHTTKDATNSKVTCPILRSHTCELCGATGDEAHTRSHCPMAEMARTDPFMKSMVDGSIAHKMHNMVALKRTRLNSAGRLRKY